MSSIPSIYGKFKLYLKSTGPSYANSRGLPFLESTIRDLPIVRMLLRARGEKRLKGPANGFRTKVKWGIKRNYGQRIPGTPVTWGRRGSLEFLDSHYCHEWGSTQFIEDEIKKQIGSVFDSESMTQQFDDIMENGLQDMYVDVAEHIEEVTRAVPTPEMENGGNTPRSLWMGLNEWKAAHGGVADGCFPGITQIQNYDPTTPGAEMAAHTEGYQLVGKTDATATGRHLFAAIVRGMRKVNFRPVELAENYTQGTEGFREMFASIDGIELMQTTLASHDHVVALEGRDKTFTLDTRFKGMELVDVPGLEDEAICPDYTAGGAPADTSSLYVAGQATQAYKTEQTSANAAGPRFYAPYQPHVRPIWDEDNFQRRPDDDWYYLEETVPDAMVTWIRNDRNLHFETFRRGLVVHPTTDI